jgi:hypothetical protein
MRCKGTNISSQEDIKKILEESNTIALWETVIDILE